MSWHELLFNLKSCWLTSAFIAAVVVALVAVSAGWHPIALVHWGLAVPAPDDYWDRFMALAQFTAASSLAYLALETFRSAGQVDDRVRKFFGDTQGDQRGKVANIVRYLQTQPALSQPQLRTLIILFELVEARRGLSRDPADQTTVTQNRRQLRLDAQALWRRAHAAAVQDPWFQGRGRSYLMHFHCGRDALIVTAGLIGSVWIHVMASVEKVIQVYVPEPMTGLVGQTLIIVLMILFGIGGPIFYIFLGRHLLQELGVVEDKGAEQRNGALAGTQQSAASAVQAALAALGGAPPAPAVRIATPPGAASPGPSASSPSRRPRSPRAPRTP